MKHQRCCTALRCTPLPLPCPPLPHPHHPPALHCPALPTAIPGTPSPVVDFASRSAVVTVSIRAIVVLEGLVMTNLSTPLLYSPACPSALSWPQCIVSILMWPFSFPRWVAGWVGGRECRLSLCSAWCPGVLLPNLRPGTQHSIQLSSSLAVDSSLAPALFEAYMLVHHLSLAPDWSTLCPLPPPPPPSQALRWPDQPVPISAQQHPGGA